MLCIITTALFLSIVTMLMMIGRCSVEGYK